MSRSPASLSPCPLMLSPAQPASSASISTVTSSSQVGAWVGTEDAQVTSGFCSSCLLVLLGGKGRRNRPVTG